LRPLIIAWIDMFSSAKDALDGCNAARIPAAPVLTPAEVIAHPHLAEREFFPVVPHAARDDVRVTGVPFMVDGRRPSPAGPAPHRPGQHTREALSSLLGYDADKIEALRQAGAIEVVEKTASAAASPERTQSAMPTPRYAAPARCRPGSALARRSMVSTRARWPTPYCGIDAGQHDARTSTGSALTPSASPTSRRARATRLDSSSRSISAFSAPPRKHRTSTCPAGARPGYFTLENVAARSALPSLRGTTNPKPSSGCGTSVRRKPSETVAAPAYSISPSSVASVGST